MTVQPRSAADYLAALQALLPPGGLTRDPGAVLTQVLAVGGAELARVDASATALLAEADPRTTDALLPQWEADLGLPDPCVGPLQGLDARRAAVVARLTASGGASPGYFVGVAAVLGFAVTLTEFGALTCEMACEQPAQDEAWRFAWRVNAGPTPVTVATCESDAETPLAAWGNALLQCTLQGLAPAHTTVLFGYQQEGS